jgi:hypothetical protein
VKTASIVNVIHEFRDSNGALLPDPPTRVERLPPSLNEPTSSNALVRPDGVDAEDE